MLTHHQSHHQLIGNSRAISDIRKLIAKVADSDVCVLISGESGTGKEIVARDIHYQSSRRSSPFVPINCGAIPSELLESELFGHEKGAFTGAVTTRKGRFELADGGTLFLDEIGDMPFGMQVKLLRVLQEQRFERVGGTQPITTNVRIIAATHRDLEKEIQNDMFRDDLFYRLNVFPIEMPPLRERVEDIPLLIKELLDRISINNSVSCDDVKGDAKSNGEGDIKVDEKDNDVLHFTPKAMESLCRYAWPGNVRELANLMERLKLLCSDGVVDIDDFPEKFRAPASMRCMGVNSGEHASLAHTSIDESRRVDGNKYVSEGLLKKGLCLSEKSFDLKQHLVETEITLIKQALDSEDWVVARAAHRLNVQRTTLVEKMRRYGIDR